MGSGLASMVAAMQMRPPITSNYSLEDLQCKTYSPNAEAHPE